MGWIYRISLYQKIQFSLILFILLPILIVSLTSYITTKQHVQDKIETTNRNLIRAIALDIEKTIDDIAYSSVFFTSRNDDLGLLQSFHVLKDITRFEDYEDHEHTARLRGLSNILLVQSTDVNLRMMIINRKNFMIMGNVEQAEFSSAKITAFEKSAGINSSNRHVLQWFKIDSESPKSTNYYYSARIIEDPRNREILATLYIGIPQSYFDRLFQAAGGGQIYLLDGKGAVIAAKSDEPYSMVNASVIRLEQSISKVDWKLVYDIPQEELTGQISNSFVLMLTVIAISVVVFLVFSVFLARGLNKPIYKLKNIAEQYVRGNRFVRFKSRGTDEIAVLGESFNRMLDEINQLFHQVELEQEEKRIFELQALFSQIRPHFLLNTLNSIKCNLALVGDVEHSDMIQSLMSLLRGYIRIHEPATLEEEFRLLKDYVQIMQMRNELTIDFTSELDGEFRQFKVPRLIIQPIIENAFIHGFRKHRSEASISLRGFRNENELHISVSDNGQGISEHELETMRKRLSSPDENSAAESAQGIGLMNIMRRLKLTYGFEARLLVNNNKDGHGVTFVIVIPLPSNEQSKEIG